MNRRVPVLVLLVALVVGGFVLDRGQDDLDAEVAADEVAATSFPMAPADGAVASSWFCAGGTADEEGFADHVVTMLNTGTEALQVDLTVFAGVVAAPAPDAAAQLDPESGDAAAGEDEDEAAEEDAPAEEEAAAEAAPVPQEPVTEQIQVGPRSRVRLALSELVTAPIASALVEAAGDALVVEHEVSSVHGFDAKPCATAASDEWHFAWGTTAREARELLVLFNPFPDDAIVEGVFSTEDTIREPGRFAGGLVVPARSTVGIDLGDDVTRREEVAATLRTRAGRIVVDRVIRLDEEDGDRGLTVQVGVPEPQRAWVFPDGLTSEDVSETYVVYNPTDELAEVEISFTLDRAEELGIPEPIDLSIAPGEHVTVDVAADGRVPTGVPHSALVRAANDVPIVAERVVSARDGERQGMTVTTGSPVESTEWWFAAGSTDEPSAQSITIINTDPQVLTRVDVLAVVGGQEVPISELQGHEIEAGERLNVDLTPRIANRADLAVVVRSSEPVVVERVLARVGDDERGLSLTVGIPSPEDRRVPIDPLTLDLDVPVGDELQDLPTDGAGDEPPDAPDDVELPEPDQTIVIEDPDAEATVPAGEGGSGADGSAGAGSGGG